MWLGEIQVSNLVIVQTEIESAMCRSTAAFLKRGKENLLIFVALLAHVCDQAIPTHACVLRSIGQLTLSLSGTLHIQTSRAWSTVAKI